MKIKESKIAFFCLRLFFGIEPFQWVAADSSKNFSPPQALREMLSQRLSLILLHTPRQAPGLVSANKNI
jgi:hypothetical protein